MNAFTRLFSSLRNDEQGLKTVRMGLVWGIVTFGPICFFVVDLWAPGQGVGVAFRVLWTVLLLSALVLWTWIDRQLKRLAMEQRVEFRQAVAQMRRRLQIVVKEQ